MATATKALKSFRLNCPLCGATESPSISLDLNDLTSVTCGECSETFTPAEAVARAAEQLARWEAVVRFVKMAGECLAE
jgi:transcription elongation factor Elf1